VSLAVTFHGTRGSIPAPGAGTVRYGGNTACVTVEHGSDLLILDAGTGIRGLGRALVGRGAREGPLHLLLSHTHWDHIHGLPFFRPLFDPARTIRILGPAPASGTLAEVLRHQMAPEVFPVAYGAIRAAVGVAEITEEAFEAGRFRVSTVRARHPAPTLGYTVQGRTGGPRAIYLTDNELYGFREGQARAELVRFLRDADLLVHDGMYFAAEAEERRGWGHSTAAEAVTVAAEAGCRTLALFHHDPDHDDATLDRLLDEARAVRDRLGASLEVVLAAEGDTIRLEDR
jgi:ribonuclease BN (tRNA processing enzyme)